MTRVIFTSLVIVFLLTSCAPQSLPTPTQPTSTASKSLSPSRTKTSTQTPSVTALPQITPSTMLPCPGPRSNIVPEFRTLTEECSPSLHSEDKTCPRSLSEEIRDYILSGGDLQTAYETLRAHVSWTSGNQPSFDEDELSYTDITGDSLPELIVIVRPGIDAWLDIFSCQNGYYQQITPYSEDFFERITIDFIQDLNLDGISDLVVFESYTFLGGGTNDTVHIYEWLDNSFGEYHLSSSNTKEYQIKDIDGNGFKEIVIIGDDTFLTWKCAENAYPWRKETYIYSWDGVDYNLILEYSPPFYRYQAIQDGDRETLQGRYDRALEYYQEAIFDRKLEWFSPERRQYLVSECENNYKPTPTPLIMPVLDQDEYPKLAAYAYYRILLINALQGDLNSAKNSYETLVKTYGNESPGHPYVEIASAFWNEYQASSNMAKACGLAILYAESHPEILRVLGSDYHGLEQNYFYQPEDVCPFH
jgi:hypothetical protein